MRTQIYELMNYSSAHIVIYVIALCLVNSAFGKRLWNSLVIRILGKEVKYDESNYSHNIDMDAFVQREKRAIEELNVQNSRKYICIL